MIDPKYRFNILKSNDFFKIIYFLKHNTMRSNLPKREGTRLEIEGERGRKRKKRGERRGESKMEPERKK